MADYGRIYKFNYPNDPEFTSALDNHLGNSITNKYLGADSRQQFKKKTEETKMSFFGNSNSYGNNRGNSGGSGGGSFFGNSGSGGSNSGSGGTGFFGGNSGNNRSGSTGFFGGTGTGNSGGSNNSFFGGGGSNNNGGGSNQTGSGGGFFGAGNSGGNSGGNAGGGYFGSGNSGGNNSGGSFFGGNSGSGNNSGNGGGFFSGGNSNTNNNSGNGSGGFFSGNSNNNNSGGGFFSGGGGGSGGSGNNQTGGGFFSGNSNQQTGNSGGSGGFFSGNSNNNGNNNSGGNSGRTSVTSGGGYFNNSSGGGYFNSGNQNSTTAAAQYLQSLLPNATMMVYAVPTSGYQNQNSYAPPAPGVPPLVQPNNMPWIEPTISFSKLQREVQNIMHSDTSIKPYSEELAAARDKTDSRVREEALARRAEAYCAMYPPVPPSVDSGLANPYLKRAEELYGPKHRPPVLMRPKPNERRVTLKEAMERDRKLDAERRSQQIVQSELYTESIRFSNPGMHQHGKQPNSDYGVKQQPIGQSQRNGFNLNQGTRKLGPEQLDRNSNPDAMEHGSRWGQQPEIPVDRTQFIEEESTQNTRNQDRRRGHGAPVLTKEGYMTCPKIEELRSWPRERLQRVQNFEVYNQFGSVKFLGQTDVTDVDLDRDVIISLKGAEVYPDDLYATGQLQKPTMGQKLNKPAHITLNEINPKYPVDVDANNRFFRDQCTKIDARFVSYDSRSKQIVFEVEHFTKYGLQDADLEEPSTANNTAQSQAVPRIQIREQTEMRMNSRNAEASDRSVATIERLLQDCDLSLIQAERQEAFSTERTPPNARNVSVTVQQKETQASFDFRGLSPTKTINQLLEQLTDCDFEFASEAALWTIEPNNQPQPNNADLASLAERQRALAEGEQIQVGSRIPKSRLRKNDFCLVRVENHKPKAPTTATVNLEASIMDAFKSVVKSSASDSVIPPQHGFGLGSEILERFYILEKKKSHPYCWKVIERTGSLKQGMLIQDPPRDEPSWTRIPIAHSDVVYGFQADTASPSINFDQSFGARPQISHESEIVPNLKKIPVYVAQHLLNKNYKEAVLFEAINVLFGLPGFTAKAAARLTFVGFKEEVQQYYKTYQHQSKIVKEKELIRHFGLLISNILKKKNSKLVIPEGQFWEAENENLSKVTEMFGDKTLDFGGRIANLELEIYRSSKNSSFGGVQAPLGRSVQPPAFELPIGADFFEVLMQRMTKMWRTHSLASIIGDISERDLFGGPLEPNSPIDKCLYLIIKCWNQLINHRGERVSECITQLKDAVAGHYFLSWLLSECVIQPNHNIPPEQRQIIHDHISEVPESFKTAEGFVDHAAILCCSTGSLTSNVEIPRSHTNLRKLKELCLTWSSLLTQSEDLRKKLESFGVPNRLVMQVVATNLKQDGKIDHAIKTLLDIGDHRDAVYTMLGCLGLIPYGFDACNQPNEGETFPPSLMRTVSLFKNISFSGYPQDSILDSVLRLLRSYFDIKVLIQNNEHENTIRTATETFILDLIELMSNQHSRNPSSRTAPPVDTDVINFFDADVDYRTGRLRLFVALLSDVIESCTALGDEFPEPGLGPILGASILTLFRSEELREVVGLLPLTARYAQQLLAVVSTDG